MGNPLPHPAPPVNPQFHLTDLDRRIVSELQRDATLTSAELARRVGTSAATCWRRLQALEAAGILGPAVRLVAPRALGQTMEAWCNVRLRAQDERSRAAFLRAVEAEPAILEAYAMSGDWDYLLHVVARDMEDFEGLLMRRVLGHEAVGGTSTQFVIRRLKHTTAIPV